MNDIPSKEEHAAIMNAATRSGVRAVIHNTSGDPESLLGTTSDAVALATYDLARLLASLADAQTLAEVRAAVAPMAERARAWIDAIDAGEVRLPALEKGRPLVESEIDRRITAVADALQMTQKG